MKKSFLSLRIFIFCATFFLAAVHLPAQGTSEGDYTQYSNEEILNLGSNGVAVIGSGPFEKEPLDARVIRFDSTSKKLWEKIYKQPYGKGRYDLFANSADGNDIYILSLKQIDEDKNITDGVALTWIDAKSGESRVKEFPVTEFGYMYTIYANNKYLFVYTTSLPLYSKEIEKNPVKTKLYRFEKATMKMELLEDEMKSPSQYIRVFWQIFRVENDFAEGYVIKEATQHIELEIARFDNNGKKIKSADVSFDLKETFPRQENSDMPLNAGIFNGHIYKKGFSGTTSHDVVLVDPDLLFVYPLASCHFHFDPVSKNYYAYGLCGYEEQKLRHSDYSGFYIARIDENFKLAAFKEHEEIELLEKDLGFKNVGVTGSRTIDATRTPTDQLVIYMSGGNQKEFYFSMDPVNLSIKKSQILKAHKYKQGYNGYLTNTFTSSLDKELYWDAEIVKLTYGFYEKFYVPTARWQYVVLVSGYEGLIKVYTSKME
ncbi:MAG: hypothetical protein ABIQ40_04200 [Bacteroidia bacterium]